MPNYDIVRVLLDAYNDMRTGSRDDLKDAADEITDLRNRIRLAQRSNVIDSVAAGYKLQKVEANRDSWHAIADMFYNGLKDNGHKTCSAKECDTWWCPIMYVYEATSASEQPSKNESSS